MFIGVVIPKAGWPERVVIGFFGSLFLLALVEGLFNIRAGRVGNGWTVQQISSRG